VESRIGYERGKLRILANDFNRQPMRNGLADPT
jgi:hypothetical protein